MYLDRNRQREFQRKKYMIPFTLGIGAALTIWAVRRLGEWE